MNTASKVSTLMSQWKTEGLAKDVFVRKLANACIGWSYVFGGLGELCTPTNRRSYYNAKKKPTIKSKCKNFEGSGSCSGCRWYPGGTTRFFDCRGFTRWLFKQVGIIIKGGGATSQYNDNSNWAEKGPIEQMPRDKVCCTFRYDSGTGKMEHTLLYDGEGNYIHDSGEVKKTAISRYKATHYAIPKGLYDESAYPVTPSEPSTPDKPSSSENQYPTIRRGDRGTAVKKCQSLLNTKFSARLEVDGIFGPATEKAVKDFQRRNNLTVDGIVGPRTWAKLK